MRRLVKTVCTDHRADPSLASGTPDAEDLSIQFSNAAKPTALAALAVRGIWLQPRQSPGTGPEANGIEITENNQFKFSS